VRIRNFRSIKNVDLDLTDTTVLIGPNNAGKTAILEALRIALTRRWGLRGTGFTEYDCHLEGEDSDPKTAPPISIEVELAERHSNQWSEDLHADLVDIIQVDPSTARGIIILRVSCAWDAAENAFIPKWEFLNSERKPMSGKGARVVNTHRFFEYIPVFYLDALRDADDEFSSRSQFWGRLLRSVTIPDGLSNRVQQVLDRVNRRLLNADPKLDKISETLSGIGKIAKEDVPGSVAIRMAPLKTWDLLSRAQVIVRTTDDRPWLPVGRHGRGVQSLSVIFLFHAFVSELLAGLFHNDSEAFLALEEPETHLHPQAARTLWRHVRDLPGQKIVTTHSPFFVQHVPFRDLRLIRSDTNGTSFRSLPASFDVDVPLPGNVGTYLSTLSGDVYYDYAARRLVVRGKLPTDIYTQLRALYSVHADAAAVLPVLDDLFKRSQSFVDDELLQDLEEYARRIRGEIFFARRWFLVEGPCEYILAHALADAAGYSLDAHGVAVIDFQNRGTVWSFAILARALGIPWIALFDGDNEPNSWLQKLQAAGFPPTQLADRCLRHEEPNLERALASSGESVLRVACSQVGIAGASSLPLDDLLAKAKPRKTDIAVKVAERLRHEPAIIDQMPPRFVQAIQRLPSLAE